MSDKGDEEDNYNVDTAGSSTVSASSAGADGDDEPLEGEEDVAKRRSKNRVNARRSRERKRLMLDTLQQEHWQLHQENKRVKLDNDKLKEAIETIKSLQGVGNLPTNGGGPPMQNLGNMFQNTNNNSNSTNNDISGGGLGISNNSAGANIVASSAPQASTGNPLMDLLAKQMMMMQQQQQQQQAAPPAGNNLNLAQLAMGGGLGALGGVNPVVTQLLLANALQQGGGGGGFNPAAAVLLNQNLLSLMQQQQQQQGQPLSNKSAGPQQQAPMSTGPAADSKPPIPGPANGNNGNNQDFDGFNNNNAGANSAAGIPPNLAGLLQSLGGGSNHPMLNQATLASAGPAGLASLLHALGGQQQQNAPNMMQSGNNNNGNPSASSGNGPSI